MTQPPTSSAGQLLTFSEESFAQMILDNTPVVVHSRDIEFSFSSYLLAYEPQRQLLTLKNTIPLDHIHYLMFKHNLTITVLLNYLHTSSLSSNGVNFVFPIERTENVQSARLSPRYEPGLTQLWLAYNNPYDGTTSYKKKVLTISREGLSFETIMASQLYRAGGRFSGAKLILGEKVIAEVGFEVVYTTKHFNIDTQLKTRVGVKFTAPQPDITRYFL